MQPSVGTRTRVGVPRIGAGIVAVEVAMHTHRRRRRLPGGALLCALLLAAAPRGDVTFPAGTGDTTHNANGVEWYYDDDYSWGFAEGGESVDRNSCDTQDGTYPERRICWHTDANFLDGGWRCGTEKSLNSSLTWERFIYHMP